jgi:hypothetical protein
LFEGGELGVGHVAEPLRDRIGPSQTYDVWHEFALDGPERCSGLSVVRYDSATIGKLLGPSFDLSESRMHAHKTPAGSIQRFQFSRFRRLKVR